MTHLWLGLMGATALERLVELFVSRRNAAWSFARGGFERGRGHFPAMVALHTAFLAGAVAEVTLLGRAFSPAIGVPMIALALASQGLRWWAIATLGPRWNTRVIVVPGAPRITGGPYRFFSHPNYAAVVMEGFALPLAHGAWITALTFSLLNIPLLAVRIRCEEQALADATAVTAGGRPS